VTSTSQAAEHLSVVSVHCQKFNKCIQQALSPYHLLANIMHPKYRGQSLTEAELNTGMELASTQYGQIVWHLINLKAQASPFQKYMFSDSVLTNVQPLDWWKSQSDRLHPDKITVANQLLTATASSAGVERIFHHLAWCIQNFATVWGLKKQENLCFCSSC
jgi:hypothetical protein